MPMFDIVSEVDMQEVDNAVNQASKEISNRFDFKGSKSKLEFDKEKKEIKILADDDMKTAFDPSGSRSEANQKVSSTCHALTMVAKMKKCG